MLKNGTYQYCETYFVFNPDYIDVIIDKIYKKIFNLVEMLEFKQVKMKLLLRACFGFYVFNAIHG